MSNLFRYYFNFFSFSNTLITKYKGEINEIEGYLSCSHRFCFVCIKNWSQYTNSCPLCKNDFLSIIKKKNGENGIERIIIEPKRLEFEEEQTENELSGRKKL